LNILVIAAHGSRKNESNQEVIALAQTLAPKVNGYFDRVEPAFLQFAQPLLETTLETLASEDPERIVVFPFFIGSGSHIKKDIPSLVDGTQKKYPHILFDITRHLGKIEAISDIIAKEVMP